MSKTYQGPRTITADQTGYNGRWVGYVDGKTYYGLRGDTKADAIAAAGRTAARMDADDFWYDRCKAVAGSPSAAGWMELPRGTSAADFFVGQRVAIYSRGDARNGLVEKVGRTNVTVIYVTASTGAIWRKSGKFAEVAIQDLGDDDKPTSDERAATVHAGQEAKAEAKRQATAAQHVADRTTPGYGTGPTDTYCRSCGCYHAEGEHADEARHSDDCGGCLPTPSGTGVYVGRHEDQADDAAHHLAGLRTEWDGLNSRLVEAARSGQERPELKARLDAVAARIAELIEAGVACVPTGRTGSDGRDHLTCGSMANPAGFCCEHGTWVRTQPQGQPESFDDDSHLAQYDDDPSPYAGTYSEA